MNRNKNNILNRDAVCVPISTKTRLQFAWSRKATSQICSESARSGSAPESIGGLTSASARLYTSSCSASAPGPGLCSCDRSAAIRIFDRILSSYRNVQINR
jgi:hypothetical protein